MKDDVWDRVREFGSKAWKGSDWVGLLMGGTYLTGSGIILLISKEQNP